MISELLIIKKVIIAALLGALIGLERETKHKPAGLRTHMLVCMGVTMFTVMSYTAFPAGDPTRVAAYTVVGMGFIGAGTIMHGKGEIKGLTTAASLWVVTAIGMAIGVGYYVSAFVVALMTFLILQLKSVEEKL